MDRARSTAGPRITVGVMLVAIGLLHQGFGLVAGLGLVAPAPEVAARAPLVEIASAGFLNAVEPDPWRSTFAWFMLFGFVLLLLGGLAHRVERSGSTVGRAFALGLAATCLLGVVLLPASGFWLGFVPAVVAWRRARASGA